MEHQPEDNFFIDTSLLGEFNETIHHLLYGLNITERDISGDLTVLDIFAEQCYRFPDMIALRDGRVALTYAALNAASDQLASVISSTVCQYKGEESSRGGIIALCFNRSADMVVAILAVLKAGYAYLPLAPDYPSERIDFILSDATPLLILSNTHTWHKTGWTIPYPAVVLTDVQHTFPQIQEESVKKHKVRPTDLAYIIYTSGTTGKPKGVLIEHHSLFNLITDLIPRYGIASGENFVLFSNYIFDASIEQLFIALLSGGTLHLVSEETIQDSGDFIEFILGNQITHLDATPSFLATVDPALLSPVKRVVFGAELLSKELFDKFSSHIPLVINAYGPTEATITSIVSLNTHHLSHATLSNTKIYVLDESSQPVPVGVTGELCIAGAGVARGYLNRPDLTQERFIENPYASLYDKQHGYHRMYKTGDMVRWTAEGQIEFVGRSDNQIKIRGYRIELGEIENTILEYPGIKQTCVLAVSHPVDATDKLLVGYYVSEYNQDEGLMDWLSSRLPDYMLPSGLVQMNVFPVTRNGKLDRSRLPLPEFKRSEEAFEGPVSVEETKVVGIWQDVLGLSRLGVTDNFFKIGGNSIKAIRIAHLMSKALNRSFKVAHIFKFKTIRSVLTNCTNSVSAIPETNHLDAPLSFSQEQLWFVDNFEQRKDIYHLPLVYELNRTIDTVALVYAFQRICERHNILRSTIQTNQEGEAFQQVSNRLPDMESVTLSTYEACLSAIKEDMHRAFDLRKEYPIRAKLYTINNAGSPDAVSGLLYVNMHHICSDAWSIEIFERELHFFYKAHLLGDFNDTLPPLRIQYSDYAYWQKKHLTSENLEIQLKYWLTRLQGVKPVSLPLSFKRPVYPDYKGAKVTFNIDKTTCNTVKQLSRQLGVSVYSILLGSINILLSKYSGAEDIVIGCPSANRSNRGTEDVIGFFVNMIANRTVLKKQQRFTELIFQIHNDQIELQDFQDLPFDKLVDALNVERSVSMHPVFQITFGLESFNKLFSGEDTSSVCFKAHSVQNLYEVEPFDLSFTIDDTEDEFVATVSYATALFTESAIEGMVQNYQYLLTQLVNSPDSIYSQANWIAPKTIHHLLYGLNITERDISGDLTVLDVFDEQCYRFPDMIALSDGRVALTYDALNTSAEQLASVISSTLCQYKGEESSRGGIIALCFNRSADMVVAILAVLKAGYAYLPLAPDYPSERIDFILSDATPLLILSNTHTWHKTGWTIPYPAVVLTDVQHTFPQIQEESVKKHKVRPTDLAYIIYTSGTTGKPKGVLIEHHSLFNLITDLIPRYGIASGENFVLFSNYIFDASIEQLFIALLSGGTLHLVSEETIQDSGDFIEFILGNQITHLDATPSFLATVDPALLSPVKRVVFGAELLSKELFDKFSSHIPLVINAYGPTEATITSIVSLNTHHLSHATLSNTKIYVLDESSQPVPVGVTGELCIAGAGVARGYLNRPDLTQERFIENPYASLYDKQHGYHRMYKTGDMVRWTAEGQIEFVGRSDNQIKIRGYRIELGEIENTILEYPGIKQTCVLAVSHPVDATDKLLVGYYVSEYNQDEGLMDWLSSRLPDYMLPSGLVQMNVFPVTRNGKLDRSRLPLPEFKRSEEAFEGPVSVEETKVVGIWQDVLGLSRLGVTDNFFKIGGNSIKAIRIAHLMSKALNRSFKVAHIFKFKTIKKILMYVEEEEPKEEQVEWAI
ncbi:MAG: amino acid adenylation domain-containing protein [Sediminibacterium sp.]|nr:amino acid adenylation domain-containing protein [Sediminibacterium sp.]